MLRVPVPSSLTVSLTRLLTVFAVLCVCPTSGDAALCERIQLTEQEVAVLRTSIVSLKAEVAAKKQRLENVRSWMPGAEAQQRLTAARAAYQGAREKEPGLRGERRRIERQAAHVRSRKEKLLLERERIRTDAKSPEDVRELAELQAKVGDHESYIRSQLGEPPRSVLEAKAMAGRLADVSHVGWLRADDLTVFAKEEFTRYRKPSYTGAERSRLSLLERDLERVLHEYGAQTFRTVRGNETEANISGLVREITALRTDAAKRLNQLAVDMRKLQDVDQRTAGGAATAVTEDDPAGILSTEASQKRIAEIESRINELEATEQRLILEMQTRSQALADVAQYKQELLAAERAVAQADQEIRETDRQDLTQAEREFDDAATRLAMAEERLPVATREVSQLRRLLNEKVAGINGTIAEAKPIPTRAAAELEEGRLPQCAFLRSTHLAALGEAHHQYMEETACLMAALPGIPDEIRKLAALIDALDCGVEGQNVPSTGVATTSFPEE